MSRGQLDLLRAATRQRREMKQRKEQLKRAGQLQPAAHQPSLYETPQQPAEPVTPEPYAVVPQPQMVDAAPVPAPQPTPAPQPVKKQPEPTAKPLPKSKFDSIVNDDPTMAAEDKLEQYFTKVRGGGDRILVSDPKPAYKGLSTTDFIELIKRTLKNTSLKSVVPAAGKGDRFRIIFDIPE